MVRYDPLTEAPSAGDLFWIRVRPVGDEECSLSTDFLLAEVLAVFPEWRKAEVMLVGGSVVHAFTWGHLNRRKIE